MMSSGSPWGRFSPVMISNMTISEKMKGKVPCFLYLCQSNSSLRSVCCRGHPVCFIRNREMESGKGQNIPQADYLVFEQEL